MSVTGTSRLFSTGVAVVLVAMVAGLTAAFVVSLSVTDVLAAVGIPDPGVLTRYGLPAMRAGGEVAAAVSVGSLLLAAFLVPPQRTGVLDVDGYRAVRVAGMAATVWAVCALLLVPLTGADTTGQPLTVALRPVNMWKTVELVDIAGAWVWTAGLAGMVAVGCRLVLRWAWTPLLLGVALLSLMPVAINGHASAGGSHDLATNGLILHLAAAAVWAGGLLAVLVHARRGRAHLEVVARRFSRVATVAFVVMAASGMVNALVRVAPADLFTTTYGLVVVAKVGALVLLGAAGFAQRARALPALAADPASSAALIRYAGVEAVLFAVAIGLGVGLGRTPPPQEGRVPTVQDIALGYTLQGPPTVARIVLDWRFDLLFGTLALVLAVTYLIGVRRLRARGDRWPMGRTTAWLLGCAVLLIATSSGLGRYAPAMFSVHMLVHMTLSMLAPILLVLGGPITLALRAIAPAGKDAPPGPREWLLAALHSPVSRFLTRPLVAAALFVGGFYGLYLGGIFDAAAGSHPAHLLMNLHFLLTGYLFYWVVIGVDPAPRPAAPVTKLAVVFGSLPFHAFFGIALMSMDTVLGQRFYRNLQLPWNTDLLDDQRLGGGIAWATGEIPLVVVMIALLVQWSRSDLRAARRFDRAALRNDDADLAAHNAMFAELARRDRTSRPVPPQGEPGTD